MNNTPATAFVWSVGMTALTIGFWTAAYMNTISLYAPFIPPKQNTEKK